MKHTRTFPQFVRIAFLSIFLILSCAPAFGAEGETAHGEVQTPGWGTSDTAKVLNFTILVIALFFILKKPVGRMLNARIVGIKEQLAELEDKKLQAEKELARYNEKLTELGKEAETIVDEYIRQGNDAKDRILKEAQATAEKLEEKAKKNIKQEFDQARRLLQAEIIEKALLQAEADIIRKISSEDQDRLVDEYLDKVVA